MRIKEGISVKEGIDTVNGIKVKNGINVGEPIIGGVELACPILTLCDPLTLVPLQVFGGVINQTGDNTLSLAYSGGNAPEGGFYKALENFDLSADKLWAEVTFDSVAPIVTGDYFVSLELCDAVGDTIEGFIIRLGEGGLTPTGYVTTLSHFFDTFPAPTIFIAENLNILDNFPYTTQMRVDGVTGDITFTDGTTTAVIASYDPQVQVSAKSIKVGVIGFAASATTITATLNAGYASAFYDPNSSYVTKDTYTPPETVFDCDPGFVSYCNFPPAPPAELPSFESGAEEFVLLNPDISVVNDVGNLNNFVVTGSSATGSTETFLLQSEWHYCPEAGAGFIAEFTINSMTPVDPNWAVQFGFGHGAVGGIEGVGLATQSFNGTDGFLSETLPPNNPLSVPVNASPGYTVQLRMDENGQTSFIDSEGASGLIGSGAFAGSPVTLILILTTPEFTPPGETQGVIDFDLVTNPVSAVLPVPAGYINVSGATQYYQPYRVFDFSSEGDAGVHTPYEPLTQTNFQRGIRVRKNPNFVPQPPDFLPQVTIPEFTGSVGSGAFTFIKNYNNNLIELECVQKSNAGMNDQIIRLAANPFLQGQLEFCHNANGTSGADGIDNTPNAWAMRYFDGFNSIRCLLPLFNHVEFEVGDTMSMGIQTVGVAGKNVALQFAVCLGGQSVVYDLIHADDTGVQFTWTPILEMKSSDNVLIGVDDTAEYKVNGRADHYKDVNIYPSEVFTDISAGVDIITAPVTNPLSANLSPFTWRDVLASSAVVTSGINGDVLTINAVGAATKAFAHCPRVVGLTYFTNALTYLAEIEITSLTTTPTTEYIFEARSPNTGLPNGSGSNNPARFGIAKFGSELYLEVVTWQGFALTSRTRLTYTGTGGAEQVNVSDGGSDYVNGEVLSVQGGSGTGLEVTVSGTFFGGGIVNLIVTNAGTGYKESDGQGEFNLLTTSLNGIGTGATVRIDDVLNDGNYQYSVGDRLSLMIGTDRGNGSPSGRRTFITALAKRVGEPVEWANEGEFSWDGGTEFEDYLLFMGHDAVPATESAVITSKFKAADMHPDIKAFALNFVSTIPAPTPTLFDLEGVSIT